QVAVATQPRHVSDGMDSGRAEVRHRSGAAATAARPGAGDAQLDAGDVLGGSGRRQRQVRQRRHARRGLRRDDGIRSQADRSMTLALYLVVAIATLLAWNRRVTPLSRGVSAVLVLLPF